MNTKQLVILWYAALLIGGVFVYFAAASVSSVSSAILGVMAVVIVSSVAVYSAGDRSNVDGRTVLLAVGIPVLLIGLATGGLYGASTLADTISEPEQPDVAVKDGLFAKTECRDPLFYECSGTCFQARVENRSDQNVGEVRLNFTLVEGEEGTRDKWIHAFPITSGLAPGEIERLDYCVQREYQPERDTLYYGVESASWEE